MKIDEQHLTFVLRQVGYVHAVHAPWFILINENHKEVAVLITFQGKYSDHKVIWAASDDN